MPPPKNEIRSGVRVMIILFSLPGNLEHSVKYVTPIYNPTSQASYSSISTARFMITSCCRFAELPRAAMARPHLHCFRYCYSFLTIELFCSRRPVQRRCRSRNRLSSRTRSGLLDVRVLPQTAYLEQVFGNYKVDISHVDSNTLRPPWLPWL